MLDAGGNWAVFLRSYVGAFLRFGYVKKTVAIEILLSNQHYYNGIERIAASGITLASHLISVPPERRKEPVLVPITKEQVEGLSLNTYTAYHEEWETRLMKFGFGGEMGSGKGKAPAAEEFKAGLINRGLEEAVKIYNIAYDNMKE